MKVIKKVFFKPYMIEWRWPSCNEEQTNWQNITFQSETGAKLAGLFSEAKQSTRGIVVCGHPMHPLAKGYFLKYGHAQALRRAGFDVFLFDFNGFGESEMGNFDFPKDILAATNFASELKVRNVGYLGISFGASWAISAMMYEKHHIKTVVLECPFTTLEEFWLRYPIAFLVLKLTKAFKPGLYRRLYPILNASRIEKLENLLLIYGDNDKITPPDLGKRFLENLPIEKNYVTENLNWFKFHELKADLKILEKVTHAKGSRSPGYFKIINTFFNKTM